MLPMFYVYLTLAMLRRRYEETMAPVRAVVEFLRSSKGLDLFGPVTKYVYTITWCKA